MPRFRITVLCTVHEIWQFLGNKFLGNFPYHFTPVVWLHVRDVYNIIYSKAVRRENRSYQKRMQDRLKQELKCQKKF